MLRNFSFLNFLNNWIAFRFLLSKRTLELIKWVINLIWITRTRIEIKQFISIFTLITTIWIFWFFWNWNNLIFKIKRIFSSFYFLDRKDHLLLWSFGSLSFELGPFHTNFICFVFQVSFFFFFNLLLHFKTKLKINVLL